MKETLIKYDDLATIITGIYFGSDDDLSDTEDLIDYLNGKSGEVAVIRSYGKGD